MVRPIGRRALGTVAVTLVMAILPIAPHTHAVAARGKPDLIVASARLSVAGGNGGLWGLRDQAPRFKWSHKTRNIGTAASRASLTVVEFIVGPGTSTSPFEAALRVPRLESNGTLQERGSFEMDLSDFEYGSYPAKVCSDGRQQIAEAKERNNCKDVGTLYVVPFSFRGNVAGIVTWTSAGGVTTISWQGTLGYDLGEGAPTAKYGLFPYRYFEGTLTVTVNTQTATGCSVRGTGQYTPTSRDAVLLDFGSDRYHSIRSEFDPGFPIPVTATCPGAPPISSEVYPAASGLEWLVMAPGGKPFPDAGLDRLRDTYTTQAEPFAVQYTWDLEASG